MLHDDRPQREIFFSTSQDYTVKLSDFGLAKDGPEGDNTHVSTRVMGTQGYAAPEYIMTGHLTAKSDVYSFGVVLLELLTGRRSVDGKRPTRERNLVEWARPYMKDAGKLCQIIDPSLDGVYSIKAAQKAVSTASQCLSQNPKLRPQMSAIVETLESLLDFTDGIVGSFVFTIAPDNDGDEENEKSPRITEIETLDTDSGHDRRNLETNLNFRHTEMRGENGFLRHPLFSENLKK